MPRPFQTSWQAAAAKAAAKQRARQRDTGHWSAEGVRVQMTRARGLTKKGLLMLPFRFQMPPSDEWSTSAAVTWSDYDTIGGDTLSRAGATGLKTISFSTLALDYEVDWAVFHRGTTAEPAEPHTPLYVRDSLEELMEAKTPFNLQVGNPSAWDRWDLEMLATLRSVDYTERAGEPDARYIGVAFTEFVRPKLYRQGLPYHPVLPVTVTASRDGTAHDSQGHRMGDTASHPVTLNSLAREYYGSVAKWRLIAKANNAWANYNPSRPLKDAPKGRTMKLKIPKAPHAAHKKGKK